MDFSRNNTSIFLSYYKPHLKLFIGDMICAIFAATIAMIFPLLSKFIIDCIIPQMKMRPLFIMIALLIVLFVFRQAAYWFIDYWGHIFGTRVEADMRQDLFSHIERQSFSFFDKHRTGHIMSRVTNDLFEVTELAHHGPEDLFISIFTLFGSFCFLFVIRRELAVIVFAYIPLILVIIIRSRKNLLSASIAVKETTAEINSSLEASISGSRVTKIFTNEEYEKERFKKANISFKNARGKYYKAKAAFHACLEFPLNTLNVIILAVAGYFIIKGEMTLSDLVAANLYAAAFISPIRDLSSFVEQYTTGMAGFKRFLELMRTHEETTEIANAKKIVSSNGNISYENVSFAYNNGRTVLKNINLTIHSGETFAFVGPSGAGKTTICNLLPRFYEITSGRILLDGIDIKTFSVESLRAQIGLVQQDVFLFAGSIKENIAYGKIGASDEEIMEAAKRAEIQDDIMKMEYGYDTVVGERGIKLSGGQKQRISIARTFLKNPPILILDEATSALDTATEIKIQKSFDLLSKGRTTLIIAHRLSTIRKATCIAVIDNNTVSELGTHEELLARGGLYKNLYTAQFELK